MENDIRSAIEGIRSGEPGDRVTARLKTELDKVTISPAARANAILTIIQPILEEQGISMYDMICFCSAYLLNSAVEYTFYKNEVIEIQKLILVYHYLYRDGE